MIGKRYLGDGVYVNNDGGALVLTVEDGIDVIHTTILERKVLKALVKYVEDLTGASIGDL